MEPIRTDGAPQRRPPASAGATVSRRRRGWGALILAAVVCPCHLPLTLPIVLGVLGGSAAAAAAAAHLPAILALSTVLFLVSLLLAWRWAMTPGGQACDSGVRPTPGRNAAESE